MNSRRTSLNRAAARPILEQLEDRITPVHPYPLQDTFTLNSLPGSPRTIYLDFDGHITDGNTKTGWNNNQTIDTPAYSIDNDPAFNNTELLNIQEIFDRVSEDFAPFRVNVTTQFPGLEALTASGKGDQTWGMRVIIGGDGKWAGSPGGVAFFNTFRSDIDVGCFAFSDNVGKNNAANIAEVVSHEVGHTVGLSHDGRTVPAEEYYNGHGSGQTSWGPIMGAAYGRNITQWSKGEYANANRPNQDDLLSITNPTWGIGYRTDDFQNNRDLAAGKFISVLGKVLTPGIIERNTDVDTFRVELKVPTRYQLSFDPFQYGPNLDIGVKLYDSSSLLQTFSADNRLDISLDITLQPGVYYFEVDGVGKGDPLLDGYTDYGSIGQYTITGDVTEFVSGTVFDDLSGNGVRNPGENGIAGRIVFLDANSNGKRDTGELWTNTDANGVYTFPALPDGTYNVRVVEPAGREIKNPVVKFHTITVTSGQFGNQPLDFAERDSNGPTGLSLSPLFVEEKLPVGTLVGTFTPVDPSAVDTFTYTFFAGTGDADNGQFTIKGNQLFTNAVFDFTVDNSYSIRVQVTDSEGYSFDTNFTISISDSTVPDAPVDIVLTPSKVNENVPTNSLIGVLTTLDPDFTDSFTYSLVTGAGSADNNKVTIVGDKLYTTAPVDFETQSKLFIRVKSIDSGSLSVEKELIVSVVNVNEVPTKILFAPSIVNEGAVSGTFAGSFSTLDPDGGTFKYALVAGTGATNNSLFRIVGNQLFTNGVAPDDGKYTIRVRSTDNGNLSRDEVFTVTINNVAPGLTLNDRASSILGVIGQPVVFTFNAIDPSAADQAAVFKYQIDWDGNGTIDQTLTGPSQLRVTRIFDRPVSSTVRVEAIDRGGASSGFSSSVVAIGHMIMLPDPTMPGKQSLYIGGSVGNDVITIGAASPLTTGWQSIYASITGGATFKAVYPYITGRIYVYGHTGNDSISVDPNYAGIPLALTVQFDGGTGRDTLIGGPNADTLLGGGDDDLLRGLGGNDLIDGGAGIDTLVEAGNVNFVLTNSRLTGVGTDTLLAIERANLTGGDGNNTLDARSFSGPVTLSGGKGDDRLIGGLSSDLLLGGDGRDSLYGGNGNDRLEGGAGRDLLEGQDGDDILIGGIDTEADILRGGNGKDRFTPEWYTSGSLRINRDNPLDLNTSLGDTLG